jgi:hypothetical protein
MTDWRWFSTSPHFRSFLVFQLSEYKLLPISVAIIYFVTPLTGATITMFITRLSRWIGRVEAVIMARCIGTGAKHILFQFSCCLFEFKSKLLLLLVE